MIRRNRLIQLFLTLMLITITLPILFTIFISRANQPMLPNAAFPTWQVPLYQQDRASEPMLDSARSNGSNNLTSLLLARQNYIRSFSGDSMEKQIAHGFADLTNRLAYEESIANDRRLEINKLTKEIRYLWSLIQKTQRHDVLPQTNSTDPTHKDSPPFSLETSEYLHLPSVFSLMSYLNLSADSSLNPIFRIAPKATRNVRFVFGIPTVKRTIESYLVATLQNLIQNLPPAERNQACFVVFVAETDLDFVHKTANDLLGHFSHEISSGLIEIISPPPLLYPNMDTLKQTLGDSMERVRWRSKQNLDYAYLMMYCQPKGVYYVQLEDDIITKPSYLMNMQNFITKQTLDNRDWIILDFCTLGFIGKLFKSADLSKFILFFMMFYNDKPVDWLLENYVETKMCSLDLDKKACKKQREAVWIGFKPSLFQHVGTHSSLKGKIQKLRDKGFGKVRLFLAHEDNPKARVFTTLQEYKNYKLVDAYEGLEYFWGFSPHKDDVITFTFSKPVSLERCLIRSGNPEHPGDILQNATFQIKPSAAAMDLSTYLSTEHSIDKDGYVSFPNVIVDGVVDFKVPRELNPLDGVRLKYQNNCTHWVILNEIYLKPLDSATSTTLKPS